MSTISIEFQLESAIKREHKNPQEFIRQISGSKMYQVKVGENIYNIEVEEVK